MSLPDDGRRSARGSRSGGALLVFVCRSCSLRCADGWVFGDEMSVAVENVQSKHMFFLKQIGYMFRLKCIVIIMPNLLS